MNSRIFTNIYRSFRKNRSFTLINICGLAVGCACTILIVLHVLKENSYNTQIPENNQVYNLLEKSPGSPLGNSIISYAISPMMAQNFPEIAYFARTENYSVFSNCVVSYKIPGTENYQSFNELDFFLADSSVFHIFQYPFIEGNPADALINPNSIVLSKETAEKYFGNQPALNKTLSLNGEYTFTVTGVVDIPKYVTFSFSMLAPITTVRSQSDLRGWDSNGPPFFKLKKGVDYKQFNAKLENFIAQQAPEALRNPEQIKLALLPITDMHLYYNKKPLYLLIFVSLVVLIVSILNYINMSTSLVQKRTSEVALKKISGAGVNSIRFDFMCETALICFISVAGGVLLAWFSAPVFEKLTGSNILYFIQHQYSTLLIASLIIWIVVTVLSAFYPSMVLSGIKPLALLSKAKINNGTKIRSKEGIITFQFVVSIILVIMMLMINRQYQFMKNMPLGFDNEYVVQLPLTNHLKMNYQNLKDELKKIPSIGEVCSASSMPVGVPNNSGVTWIDDQNLEHNESFGFAIVTEGYTQTFKMPMVAGNEFTLEKADALRGVIINEAAANKLGYANPVGHQIHFWGRNNTIIGVVTDFQNNYMFNRVKPMILSAHPQNQGFTKFLFISVHPQDMMGTISKIEKTLKQISPEFPFEYHFIRSEVEQYINEIKQINNAFRFAGVISILLAIIGMVALIYHSTQSRIKEIGIRKVNGAKSVEILFLLNSNFIKLVIVAFIIALPIAWLILVRLLQGIENHTTIEWWIFAFSGILTLGLTLLTVSLQSWRAASRNPVEALRYE